MVRHEGGSDAEATGAPAEPVAGDGFVLQAGRAVAEGQRGRALGGTVGYGCPQFPPGGDEG